MCTEIPTGAVGGAVGDHGAVVCGAIAAGRLRAISDPETEIGVAAGTRGEIVRRTAEVRDR